ncbi:MAG: hypothetical protein Kow0092_20870 [Deferrisomatales bacterium]
MVDQPTQPLRAPEAQQGEAVKELCHRAQGHSLPAVLAGLGQRLLEAGDGGLVLAPEHGGPAPQHPGLRHLRLLRKEAGRLFGHAPPEELAPQDVAQEDGHLVPPFAAVAVQELEVLVRLVRGVEPGQPVGEHAVDDLGDEVRGQGRHPVRTEGAVEDPPVRVAGGELLRELPFAGSGGSGRLFQLAAKQVQAHPAQSLVRGLEAVRGALGRREAQLDRGGELSKHALGQGLPGRGLHHLRPADETIPSALDETPDHQALQAPIHLRHGDGFSAEHPQIPALERLEQPDPSGGRVEHREQLEHRALGGGEGGALESGDVHGTPVGQDGSRRDRIIPGVACGFQTEGPSGDGEWRTRPASVRARNHKTEITHGPAPHAAGRERTGPVRDRR